MSFTMSHSIILPHPISDVFTALSQPEHMERLQKLTPEAQQFTLLPSDSVSLPCYALSSLKGGPNIPQNCPLPRDLPSFDLNLVSDSISLGRLKLFHRTWFQFSGTVPLLFGLINRPLSVSGAQIVDEEAKVVLFESAVAEQGIREVKLRTFREVQLTKGHNGIDVEGPERMGTEVTESVWGTCPFLLSLLLRFLAPNVHRGHMELYHQLF